MWKKRNRLAVIAGVAAAALALSACSGGGGGDGGGERVFARAIAGDPMGLNAQLISGSDASMFSAQIFDSLIRISPSYELSPGLAESWELSDDELTLTLNLREGVTWHDGEPFTAEDVKFNLEEIVELQSFGARLAAAVSSVDIVDDSTVDIHFSQVFGPLFPALAQQYMIPKHVYEGTDYVTNTANMEPIGTGPMMFDSYESGQQVVLKKNPDYWEGEVQVDTAVYPIMGDPNSRATALFAGELDTADIDASQQGKVSDTSNLHLLTEGFWAQLVSVMFNGKSPYLSDPAVRAAVFAAMDREAITDTALSGLGTPATTFFPESIAWAVNDDVDFDADFPHDVDAINDALDESFPVGADGLRFTLNARYIQELSDVAATAEMAKSMFEEVGIGLNLIATSPAVFTEKVYTESDFDLAFLRSTVGADPSIGIVRWYECNDKRAAAANPSQICDPQIDAAAQAALASTDETVRGQAFKDLQARAAELMLYAPLAWFNGAFPTINDARWTGLDAAGDSTGRMNWLGMKPAGS